MNILFYPAFTDTQTLTDHYYRLHWYLYPFKEHISKVTLLSADKNEAADFVPDYLDPSLKQLVGDFTQLQVKQLDSEKEYEAAIAQSDIVLLWDIDPTQPLKVPNTPFSSQVMKKKIIRIDHKNERFASSFYLKISELFIDDLKQAENDSREIFKRIYNECKSKKGYIFGTGPNLRLLDDKDFSDGVNIACNSMVRNRELLDRLKPPIIVVADPIFHAGPSIYAAEFRKELIAALDRYKSYLIVPLRDYHIYKTHLPPRFHERICAVPFKSVKKANLNLNKNFYVASTANVLTLFLLPLASTLFEEILISGCDGRPANENTYFWGHDKASQFNEHMDSIKIAHPAFFDIDYDDYYAEHCKTLDNWLSAVESAGRYVENLTPSYIPALTERYRIQECEASNVSEVIMLDPDAIDEFGHFLAYDDRLAEAFAKQGTNFSVFGNINCAKNITDSRPHFEPVFSKHSWSIGNTLSPKDIDVAIFTKELRAAIQLRYERGLSHKTRLYMYCGSLPMAKIVSEVLEEFENLSAVICLFWLSFIRYDNSLYIKEWKNFLLDNANNTRLHFTLPTQRLAFNVERVFGIRLPVAPHSSTTFSDVQVEKFIEEGVLKKAALSYEKVTVLFPGGVRQEKGFDITADFIKKHAKNVSKSFDFIVRAFVFKNTPRNMKLLADDLAHTECEFISNELTNEEFSDLLKSSDIIVLPYKAPAFSERTSGLLIDAMYLGKPVIVLSDTWLADIVEEYENGIVLTNYKNDGLLDALTKISENLEMYQLHFSRSAYFRNNSWHKLTESILSFEGVTNNMKVTETNLIKMERVHKAVLDETLIVENLLSSTPPRAVMVDVGAHHGSALIPFHKLKWDIFAFEPDPKNREYLVNRYGKEKNVVISPKAVSETVQKNVDFYSSKESTGISGLLKFHDTHIRSATVDTTTIAEIVKEHALDHINFLKIDVEGYDLSVLKGVPWDSIKPDVIQCKFEDAKTKLLGHNWEDICKYLVDKGYIVYVSEWHPVIRYGIRHDWCALKKYPCALEVPNAWGNLLAFKEDPGTLAMQQALQKVLKVANPEKPLVNSVVKYLTEAKNTLEVKPQTQNTNQTNKAASVSKLMSARAINWHRPHLNFSSYAQFAEWVQSKNLTLFRIGQFVMWMLRFSKRHSLAMIIGVTVFLGVGLSPVFMSAIAPFSLLLWSAAGVLMLAVLLIMGVSFGNKKMSEFAEKEFFLRQLLKDQLQRDYQSKLKDITTLLENQGKQQADKHAALERKVNRLASAPVFNIVDYQNFNRKLNKEHIEILLNKWAKNINIKVTPKSLAYLAHRVCILESNSRGRLATNIEDILLRALVASSVKSDNLRVLEIGTLFGIGLTAIYDLTKVYFNNVHLTAIDPLDGYYGKNNRDIVTNEIVSERTFRENLSVAGVHGNNVTLLKMMSTDEEAIKVATSSMCDVLIIDGDHSFAGVKADFENYFHTVKPGGYIIFDDYVSSDWPDVTRFVDEFVKPNPNLEFVGASWNTVVFRIISNSANRSESPTQSTTKIDK